MNYNKDIEIVKLKIELNNSRMVLLRTQEILVQNELKALQTELENLSTDKRKYDDIANEKIAEKIDDNCQGIVK
jgi:rRNA maturation endonuclease Nob1